MCPPSWARTAFGMASYAHLEAGTVFYEFRAVLSDGSLDFVRFAEMGFFQRSVVFHEDVYHVERDHGLSPGSRHIGVDHCDYRSGAFYGGKRRIY